MTEITNRLSVRRLHRSAMDIAEQAMAMKKTNSMEALSLYDQAYRLEAEAASQTLTEPARSVLHRSAASLALEAGAIREAEKLIATCLSEDPPEGIAEELRNLLETVNFQRHLRLQGIELSEREFQFSISGSGVDYGSAPSDAVLKRVGDIQKILTRTAQRVSNVSFEVASKSNRDTSDNLTLYLEVARAQSYAVTLRLGQQKNEIPLLKEIDNLPAKVIDEFLDCISLVNKEEYDALEERIGEPSYYKNFVALARNIAPDGETVKLVGFTSQVNKVEKQVEFTIPREQTKTVSKIKKDKAPVENVSEIATAIGVLKAADSIKNKHQIKLVSDEGVVYTIIVPKELMNDIVRPYFGERVKVLGNWYGPHRIVLSDLILL